MLKYIFPFETLLFMKLFKAYKIRWNALFCAQDPSVYMEVNGNLCDLIIYNVTKPPELNTDWRANPVKRDRGTYEYFAQCMLH